MEISKLLVENGADVCALNKSRETPLMHILNGREKPSKELIDFLAQQDYSRLLADVKAAQDKLLADYYAGNLNYMPPVMYSVSAPSNEVSGTVSRLRSSQQNTAAYYSGVAKDNGEGSLEKSISNYR